MQKYAKMKKLINYTMLILLTCSCGKLKHDVDVKAPKDLKIETPTEFTYGPDFDKAAKFCDDRYDNADEAEACFQDYRDYMKIEIGFNVDALETFCSKYEDVEACVDELRDLFRLVNVEEGV